MYRILIADDEGIMLESLKNIISSNYGNECEIHTAKTGRVVVEEAEKYPPDICFMDIQMPGLSGIQAIREIQKFNRSVVFVIITAYDKFNYAKEAVNLGVMEFLTKPVNKKVILEICSKAMEKVDSTRQKRSDDLRIREKLETVVPMIESGYINNILLQDDFQTYQDNYRELLDIREEYGYMIVAEFGDSTENGVLTNAVGASVKANKFYSTFREIAQGFFECLVGPIMGNRIVLLVPYRNSRESYEERVEVVTRTRNMVHKLESRIDSKFRCGIGRVKEMGSTMKESFKEAMIALRESTSHVIHIEDVPAAQKYDGEYPRDLERRYEKRVMDKDVAGALSCAEEFIRWMEKQPGVDLEDMRIKILELVMGVEKKAFFAGTVKYAISCRRNYIHEIQGYTDIEHQKSAVTWKVQGKKKRFLLSKKQSPIFGTITKKIFHWMRCHGRWISALIISASFLSRRPEEILSSILQKCGFGMQENFSRIQGFPSRRSVRNPDTATPIISAGYSKNTKA